MYVGLLSEKDHARFVVSGRRLITGGALRQARAKDKKKRKSWVSTERWRKIEERSKLKKKVQDRKV